MRSVHVHSTVKCEIHVCMCEMFFILPLRYSLTPPFDFLHTCKRNGMNIDTGIDLEKLVDAGTYICNVLEQPRRSKAGVALAAGGGAGGSSK